LAVGGEKNMEMNMSRRMKRIGHAGFTLIELLLVLIILGVLAAVVVPKFTGKTLQAQISGTKTSISNLGGAINNFEVENGRFPTSDEGLQALLQAPNGLATWHGPYIDPTGLKDPWDQPFHYTCPGTHNPNGFDLFSSGPDKQEGTSDDITNWNTN
jgi:general secretion pathway protein G